MYVVCIHVYASGGNEWACTHDHSSRTNLLVSSSSSSSLFFLYLLYIKKSRVSHFSIPIPIVLFIHRHQRPQNTGHDSHSFFDS